MMVGAHIFAVDNNHQSKSFKSKAIVRCFHCLNEFVKYCQQKGFIEYTEMFQVSFNGVFNLCRRECTIFYLRLRKSIIRSKSDETGKLLKFYHGKRKSSPISYIVYSVHAERLIMAFTFSFFISRMAVCTAL